MTAVDKSRLRAAFTRGATAYDARASLQREVALRTAAWALEAAPDARRVLDVGCGTGGLLETLGAARPDLALAGVDLAPGMAREAARRLPRASVAVGDAESLPFPAASFDLVVSTSTFQWLPRLDRALSEVRRVLAPGGAFCLALFCADTLAELRRAWAEAAPGQPGVHRFAGEDEVATALRAASLPPFRLESERRVEWHATPRDLVRALREIGAGNAAPGRTGGLGMRRAVLEMEARYAAAHGGGAVPATWHVAWIAARAA